MMTVQPEATTAVKGLNYPSRPAQAIGRLISDDLFTLPLMTLSEPALEHNAATMARLCAQHGIWHAPHVKTAMSKQIYAYQQRAGVWGATVATAYQLHTVLSWGEKRVMLANELTDPRDLARLCEAAATVEASSGSEREILIWVDSRAGADALASAIAASGQDAARRNIGVLIELGLDGGRSGVREVSDAVILAERVHAAGIRVVGVAGYEGPLIDHSLVPDPEPKAPRMPEVRRYIRKLATLAAALDQRGLISAAAGSEQAIVSVGGSDVVDVVLNELAGAPVQGMIRSGAYITHDHGLCARANPWQFLGAEMIAAARVWASVISVPEPGLALANAGRRDLPFDIDLPVVLGPVAQGSWRVSALNDQHAFLVPDPDKSTRDPAARASAPSQVLKPGDIVELGISHPCTLFDKWRYAFIVDGDGRVVDVASTQF